MTQNISKQAKLQREVEVANALKQQALAQIEELKADFEGVVVSMINEPEAPPRLQLAA